MSEMGRPLLEVRGLRMHFPITEGVVSRKLVGEVKAVDGIDFSVRREVKEETGVDASEFTAEPGWTTVVEGALIAQIKVLRSSQTGEVLAGRMRGYLSRENNPELSDICIVRSPRDFTPAMPRFVTTFLARRFGVL